MLAYIRIFVFFLVYILTLGNVLAFERVEVLLDRSIITSGESLHGDAYVLGSNHQLQYGFNSVYVDLVNRDGQSVYGGVFPSKNGFCPFSIKVSHKWSEGEYNVRAYTLGSIKRFPDNYSQYGIIIRNGLKTPDTRPKFLMQSSEIDALGGEAQVRFDKQVYARRDQVEVAISLKSSAGKPLDGKFTVSVVESGILPEFNKESRVLNNEHKTVGVENKKEKNGNTINVSGLATDPNGKPLRLFFITFFDPMGKLKNVYVRTNENGQFSLDLPPFYGERVFYAHAWQANTLVEPIIHFNKPNLAPQPFKTPNISRKTVEAYAYDSFRRNKFERVFGVNEVDTTHFSETRILEVPDRYYRMSDYVKLYNVRDVFREIIAPTIVRKKKKKPIIKMLLLKGEGKYIVEPIFMINGVLTLRSEDVLSVPLKDLRSVRIYNQAETINKINVFFAQRGFVVLETKENYRQQAGHNKIVIKGFSETAKEEFPNYSEGSNDNGNTVPDFRPVLYRESGLTLKNGSAKIRFSTSDDLGYYTVKVSGFNSVDGKFFEVRKSFRIEDSVTAEAKGTL
ncbi:hypothetical protein FUAX_52550 (plasmid) [Fulvitalea axinellae]|uniref:Macroglobulin domain-containing protein n=1 Tax=Fulvitalea axinellae TaxID=1182444 RepID=A0AAU9CRP0_9BACT|nr:hypothetical protein FUAX_52550 [Fulvitalea axinellae]